MSEHRYKFPASRRVGGKRQFAAVFDARVRQRGGPLMVYARPNGLPSPRLGISISRSVGTAVRRNRIKRLLREAFRHLQHDLPVSYDFVVVPRPHMPLGRPDYEAILSGLMKRLHADWEARPADERSKQ